MKEIREIGLQLSSVAEQKFNDGEFFLSRKLYRLAQEIISLDISLLEELAKRLESTDG